MNTVLRVLVIVITLLGATALTFAVLNFNKRQVLLTRVSVLVDQVAKIAKTIEAQDAPEVDPLKKMVDDSPVTDRVDGIVNEKNVLDAYNASLEAQSLTKLEFGTQEKKDQLHTLYATEEVDGKLKIKKDSMGQPITEGAGTMKELLDLLQTRANAQTLTLDKTRGALTKMRELVEDGVDSINKLKEEGRIEQKKLTDAREEIVGLKDDKTKLQGEVASLQSTKRELELEIAEKDESIEKLQEVEATLTATLEGKELVITNLTEKLARIWDRPDIDPIINLSAGDKGKVIESNDEYKFAVIEFSPAAMLEILGPEGKSQLPPLSMNVRRSGRESAADDFITKVKLRHTVQGKNLVVADILTDWQQATVEKGDVIFF